MRKISLFFIIFILTSINIYSKFNTDSLIKELSNVGVKEKIDIYNQLIQIYYIIGDSAKCEIYAKKGLHLAQQTSDKESEIEILATQALVYSYYDPSKSEELIKRLIPITIERNYNKSKSYLYYLLGSSYLYNDIEKAFLYLTLSQSIATDNNYEDILAFSLSSIGKLYSMLGNYNEALRNYLSSLKIFEKLKVINPSPITLYNNGELINSLGIIYKKLENYQESIKYYEKYRIISEQFENMYGVGIAYNNIGIIYYKLKDYSKAIECYDKASQIFSRYGIEMYIPNILLNLGNIYGDLKNFDKSLENFELAKQKFIENNNMNMVISVNTNIGDLYLDKNDYTRAKKYFELSLLMSENIVNIDKEIIMTNYKGLSIVYEKLGRFKDGLFYHKKYSELKDSLAEINKAQEIGMLTENYKNEKKIEEQKRLAEEQEKIEQEQTNRRYNLQYSGISILLLMFFSFIFFIGRFNISTTRIESIVFVALLFLFEFILVFIEPISDRIIGTEPVYKLLVNGLCALALTPLDTYLEKIIRKKVVK